MSEHNTHTNYLSAKLVPGPLSQVDIPTYSSSVQYWKHPERTASEHGLRVATPETWHARLGHLSLNNMDLLVSKDMVTGYPLTRLQIQLTKDDPNRFYELYVKSNSKRFPSPSSKSAPSSRILELLHTDIAGPYGTPSLTGMRYILTVLDDFTKLSSVECVKSKDHVPDALISICKNLENQCTYHPGSPVIKAIRCDNGKEYINGVVKD
jgi:hypothetical protein